MSKQKERVTWIAKVLTGLREKNEYSQADIAAKIGITRSAYSYYELGKANPSLKTLEILSRFYNVPINVFFDT